MIDGTCTAVFLVATWQLISLPKSFFKRLFLPWLIHSKWSGKMDEDEKLCVTDMVLMFDNEALGDLEKP